jgi:predicted ATP-dependent endonuclease of OLD family
MAKLEGRATHRGGGGAPAEYREIKKSLKSIRSIADDLVLPLWEEVKSAMPPGLANDATVTADLDPASLVSWIADRIELRITTGAHDQGTVPPAEVGSGLQSLLELALQQTRFDLEDIDRVIAVEEPEAFLHPSAQRTLARIIAGNRGGKRIVSTHSPVLVDEAKYGEIVLVRDHRFYAPAPVSDAVRNSINTALLNGYGAEMAFAASVLLVEGDGDRAYYEVLRRRLASASGDGRLDNLAIVPVGSKTAFAPWLRMLKGYGEEGDRPIGWLVVADGDAAKEVLDGHRKAGLQMPSLVKSALADVSEARNASDQTRFIDTTTHANAIALEQSVALHLSPIDLEYAVLMGCSDDRAADLASEIGLVASDRETLTCTLRNNKQAFRRADLAMRLGWHEVSEDTRDVLRKWFSTIISNDEATQIVEVGD